MKIILKIYKFYSEWLPEMNCGILPLMGPYELFKIVGQPGFRVVMMEEQSVKVAKIGDEIDVGGKNAVFARIWRIFDGGSTLFVTFAQVPMFGSEKSRF